jgi:hypothetical protein
MQADPDSTYHPDADPDPDFYLMDPDPNLTFFTLMLIRIKIQI